MGSLLFLSSIFIYFVLPDTPEPVTLEDESVTSSTPFLLSLSLSLSCMPPLFLLTSFSFYKPPFPPRNAVKPSMKNALTKPGILIALFKVTFR